MKIQVVMTVAALALMTGCGFSASARRSPVTGVLFTGVQNSDNVTENTVSPKIGKICATSFLGEFAFGSAAAAGAAGTMQRISIVDDDMTSILGIYAQHCTVVHDVGDGAPPTPVTGTPAPGTAPPATPIGVTPSTPSAITSPPPPPPPAGTPVK